MIDDRHTDSKIKAWMQAGPDRASAHPATTRRKNMKNDTASRVLVAASRALA